MNGGVRQKEDARPAEKSKRHTDLQKSGRFVRMFVYAFELQGRES
jgi:hypothetical protein